MPFRYLTGLGEQVIKGKHSIIPPSALTIGLFMNLNRKTRHWLSSMYVIFALEERFTTTKWKE